MDPIIQVQHLCKTFQVKGNVVDAAKDISFDIERGDIFGIIGLSGAGKSTLVRCLNLLEQPTSGDVIVDGKNLTKLSDKELRLMRRDIGMIFQHFNLLMQKTVLDNVCFPMKITGVKGAKAKERAMELLRTVGLEDKANAILRSFPADRNRELRSRGYLRTIRRSCCVTKRRVHLIRRPQSQSLAC